MASYIYNDTRNGDTGSLISLASLDTLILGSGAYWSLTVGVPIVLSFANRVTIHGQVYSGGHAITASENGNQVTIGTTGILSAGGFAILTYGQYSRVDLVNAGFISSNNGASLGAATLCVNSGTILGLFRGVAASSTGAFTLTNSGLISAQSAVELAGTGSFSIMNTGHIAGQESAAIIATGSGARGQIVNRGTISGGLSLEPTGAVSIVNSGAIDGALVLGSGDDVIDSTGGHLSGLVMLGAGDDEFFGSLDGDVVQGGTGADALDGGAGIDIASYESADSFVIADLAQPANNAGEAAGDTFVSIEGLSGSRFGDQLYGDARANRLWGNESGDLLDGRAGADLMRGGTGNDTYVVDNAGDRVIERADAGLDTVVSSVGYTLPGTVEVLVLTGTKAIDGTGNALNNAITGNAAANMLTGGDGGDTLDGGAGADTLVGGNGDDTFVVDNAGDTIIEYAGGGNDVVRASFSYTLSETVEILYLTGARPIDGTGSAANNSLFGNDAANVLNGGGGQDYLYGGGGADRFVIGANQQVSIGDFVHGTDKIALSKAAFPALSGGTLLSAAQFHAGSAAADASDRIIYDHGTLYYDPDGTGAQAQVQIATFVNLSGPPTITASDILLIG